VKIFHRKLSCKRGMKQRFSLSPGLFGVNVESTKRFRLKGLWREGKKLNLTEKINRTQDYV
jgi:uncharacterized protein YutD